jgi:protein involved in ribonucleotide reduction
VAGVFDIVYFSNVSENTKRFVEKLGFSNIRIPIKWDDKSPLVVEKDFILVVPSYGGGAEGRTVPKSVVNFLNIEQNRNLLRGIVGTGNTNFGVHYCKAAEIVAVKTGAPLLYRVEITGTPDDVIQVQERLSQLWTTNIATTN